MSDRAPLYFTARLGGLFPANRAAEEAMREIDGTVRATLTGGKANQRRRSLYWVLVSLVTPILNDMHNMTLTDDDLHDIMRDKLGMFDEVTLPSGEVHRKRWSTSNRAMNEADRAEYLNKCIDIWSRWTGVDVTTLREEARRAA
ncbi:MAG TPA: hypothetical protein PKD99_12450 [Sphingopyxis sp.]|nr:hypothetical protein [Sphingopyxis sp.]HMP45909.1 hypothetical protein [Sphingopyxis sp.]